MARLLLLDIELLGDWLAMRRSRGIDLYDEVWDGVYVIPPLPTLAQQGLVGDLCDVFHEVVKWPGHGTIYPGVNVSDRRRNWEDNFRIPDVAVVLRKSRAVDCDTHFFRGPDILVEIASPDSITEEKVPFYAKIGVRELLIIHRDKRTLRLLRHDGAELVPVPPSDLGGKEWLVSEVLPLAFRRTVSKGAARTQVRRTDGQPGLWTV